MRKFLLTPFVCLIAMSGMAQDHWCASDQYFSQQVAEDPQVAIDRQQMVEAIHQSSALSAKREGDKHIIPVVFHVIWDECEDNISLAQIKDGLRVVNEDLNRLNADSSSTRDEFKGVAANSEIEMRLARIDPDGNPTDGVVRVESPLTANANNSVKNLSRWPTDQYFNIWVVQNIQNFGGGGGIILGYAQFPGSGSWNTYGVVIRHDAVGTIGTSTADGRTLTHELGHTFNLYHTFQGGCGGSCSGSGDFICDTPPSAEPTYNCNFGNNSCGNDAVGSAAFDTNVPDMIENYMSYDACQNLFTEGQKAVMKATLDNVPRLENLTSPENLAATGVSGLVKADFSTDRYVYCTDNPVQFQDQTFYDPTSLNWTFPGDATPGTSTIENPVAIFADPGLKSIELEAQLGIETVNTNEDAKFLIVDREGQFGPFVDDMEDESFLPTGQWYPVNLDEDEFEWVLNTEVALSGSNSLMMENYGNCGGSKDDLITQSFDFSTFTEAEVSFKVAFAQREATNNDFLRFYASPDCGATWQLLWVQGGNALAGDNEPQAAPFVPDSEDDWSEFTINLGQDELMIEGVIFRFQFNSRGGNNLYMDDFGVDGTFIDEVLLRAPEDGKQGLADVVTLDWKAVRGVDAYEYQLDKTPDFNGPSLLQGSNPYINDLPINEDTEFETPPLDLSTTYYWRVRTTSGGATSAWSETWSFTISETGVGVANVSQEPLKVYPNPVQDQINVVTEERITQVALIDVSGRVVRTWNTSARSLDASGIEAGVYSLIVTTAEARHTKQLIIQ